MHYDNQTSMLWTNMAGVTNLNMCTANSLMPLLTAYVSGFSVEGMQALPAATNAMAIELRAQRQRRIRW